MLDNKIGIDDTKAFRVVGVEVDGYGLITGTPIFAQSQTIPTANEDVNREAFDQGILIFRLCRTNDQIYLLKSMDVSNNQTWVDFPLTASNLEYIVVLPILQKLYWCVSSADPTPTEALPNSLLDWTCGILWWNLPNGRLFKLTAYDANTGIQTWIQIV